jgi:hypothetical protein
MQVADQVTKFPTIAVPPPVRVATGTVIDVPCQLVFDRVARLDAVPLTAARFGARWVVRVSEPSRRWCVETFTVRGWASVDYELDETSTGCFLRETVEFRSHGWRRTLDEGLTRVQIKRQSRRALARLKASLEEHHGAGASRPTLSPAV